jgi:hypothetical protein
MSARGVWQRLVVAALFVAGPGSGLAQAVPALRVNVDCANGGSIARALAMGDERKPLVVVIRGTCAESVAITRSDVTLAAGPGGAIAGPDASADVVTVSANRVTIDGLAISGGREGVMAVAAGALAIRNTTVSGTGRSGIYLSAGTSARIAGSTVQGSPRDGVAIDSSSVVVVGSLVTGNGRFGVIVTNGGSARIGLDSLNATSGSAITGNGAYGLGASLGGSVYVAMTEISGNGTDAASVIGRGGVSVSGGVVTFIGGNTISGNASAGVNATRGGIVTVGDSSFGLGTVNTISQNDGPGIFGFMGTSIRVQDAVITANAAFGLGLSLRSQGQLVSSTIQGNAEGIRLVFGSGLFVSPPSSTVSNNTGYGVQCTDGESSLVNTQLLGLGGNTLGGVSPTCTGF